MTILSTKMFQSSHLLLVITCISVFFHCSCRSEHCTFSVSEKILIVKDGGMADINIKARGDKCANSSITVWDLTKLSPKTAGACNMKSGSNGSFSCVATIGIFYKLGPRRLRFAGRLGAINIPDVFENITVFGIIKEFTVYSEGVQQNENINCTQIQTPSNGTDYEDNINSSNSTRNSNITTAAQAENDTCPKNLTSTRLILSRDGSNNKTNRTLEVILGTNLTIVCSWTGNASVLMTRNGQRLQSTVANNTLRLVIAPARCSDGGLYVCGSDLVTENRSLQLLVQCPDIGSSPDNVLLIIINSSAGLFFILLVVTVVCCCRRKRNAAESTERPEQCHDAGPDKLQIWNRNSVRLSDVYDQALPLANEEEGEDDEKFPQQDQLWRPLPRVPSGKDGSEWSGSCILFNKPSIA